MATADVNVNIHYRFVRHMTAYETWKYLNIDEDDVLDRIIAELELGTVRIAAVACVRGLDHHTCYDIFVKDEPDAKEFVFHGSIYEWIDYVAADMEELLTRKLKAYLEKNSLSLTECNFPRKEGYAPKK